MFWRGITTTSGTSRCERRRNTIPNQSAAGGTAAPAADGGIIPQGRNSARQNHFVLHVEEGWGMEKEERKKWNSDRKRVPLLRVSI